MNRAWSVAYQGERGAFSESAARRILGDGVQPSPRATFEEMFRAVQEGESDCCVAPIENSLAGSIHRNYDLLLSSQLTIAGETHLRIVHNVITRPGVGLNDVKRVYSHPVALAQCRRFFDAHPEIEEVPVHDTAGAVRMILERDRPDEAAIASLDAASIYGGEVVAGGVEDHSENFTRFLLLTRPEQLDRLRKEKETTRWKTSIVFRTGNRPGALFRALGAFALLEIDLSKIESRPVEGKPWEYAFYLDFTGREGDPIVDQALGNLRQMSEMVRVLGSYPSRW